MKLILIRHGETEENNKGISQGQMNTQLNQKGIEQSKELAQKLKSTIFQAAYSSDLDRAIDTCKIILKHHPNIKLNTYKELRDQSKGIFEGTLNSDRKNFFKENNIRYEDWKPEGGENLWEVWDRTIPFLKQLEKKHKNETVLMVSHGCPIACIIAYKQQKTLKEFEGYQAKNAEVLILKI